MILTKCREITRADAGSIYLVEEDEPGEEQRLVRDHRRPKKFLRFKMAQNDSVQVPFREVVLPVSESSIAGYVAQHGSVVMIEDAYEMESWVPYAINKQFDIDSGYRTKSILAVAMMNPKNEIVGVVQLINAKRNWRARLSTPEDVENEVLPFSTRQMEIVSSLASQAAVAYENSHLYENIQRLFEGFVKASISAIEQRDPTTSGHSFRVANLTVALAEAVDRDQTYYRDVKFTRVGDEGDSLRLAAARFRQGRRARRGADQGPQTLSRADGGDRQPLRFCAPHVAGRVRRAEAALPAGEGPRSVSESKLPQFDAELEEQLKELDRFAEIIRDSNEPSRAAGRNL